MNECWPSRSTSFLRSGLCGELWSWQGEGERHTVADGKSACFDVETVVEIDGVKAGPTRSHVTLRNLRVERSKSARTTSGSCDSRISFGTSSEFELALVFEKPGRFTLPIFDITRIRCKYLHQGKASIEARESLFLLTATSQNELERLLEVMRDVKAVKILADSRLCAACKEKGEHKKKKKIKQKREEQQQHQQPTDFEPTSWPDGDCQATKKQKLKVLECIFRKKQLPSLADAEQDQVCHIKDLLRSREHGSEKPSKTGMPVSDGSFTTCDSRLTESDDELYQNSRSHDISPEDSTVFRVSPVQPKVTDAQVVKPSSPTRKAIFIGQIKRRNSVEGVRRRDEPNVVGDQRREIERGNSAKSSEEEKENFDMCADEDLRNFEDETVKRFAQRRGMTEVLRKVQEEQRRVEEEKKRREDRRKVEVDEKREAEEKEKMFKRKETLKKLLEQERKRKDEWEAKKEEERRWKEEEDGRKLKAEEERLRKSLERRLQEEDRLRNYEKRREEEKRKEEERRKRFMEIRFQEEENRRKDGEDRRAKELKQREEERKLQEQKLREEERKLQEQKLREDERKLQEQKQREEERKLQEQKKREDERKLQEQKQGEEERKLQEQKKREEERNSHEQKRREEEYKRVREVERRLQDLKQSEEEDKQFKEVLRKLEDQIQEQIQEKRKQEEESMRETMNFFKQEEDRQKLREQEELRKFQESVKITNRLSHRFRRSRVSAEARMSPQEIRKILEEQLDKLDPRKLDEDMRRWRAEENERRSKEDSWVMPNHERSVLEEQRKRVEEVMKMSRRLHRKSSERMKIDENERKQAPGRTVDAKVHNYPSAEVNGAPDKYEFQNSCFQDKTFLDQLFTSRENQNPSGDGERLGKGGETFKPTETFLKPDRSRQEVLRKAELERKEEMRKSDLERKKAEKAADEQKKRLAHERMKAAKLEARRLEKLLKEAQKRAKAEDRQRQQQKTQEHARQKLSAGAASGLPRVHHLTYRQYEDSWNIIKTSGKKTPLAYSDIPWPPHGNPLFVEEGDSLAAQRRKLRTALLRWHPDKFLSFCGHRLSPLDKVSIEIRAKTVAQDVIQWKSKLDNMS